MGTERYRLGARRVTEIQFYFVWRTKYSYGVLKWDLAARLMYIIHVGEPGSFKVWDEPESEALESDSSENSDDFKS